MSCNRYVQLSSCCSSEHARVTYRCDMCAGSGRDHVRQLHSNWTRHNRILAACTQRLTSVMCEVSLYLSVLISVLSRLSQRKITHTTKIRHLSLGQQATLCCCLKGGLKFGTILLVVPLWRQRSLSTSFNAWCIRNANIKFSRVCVSVWHLEAEAAVLSPPKAVGRSHWQADGHLTVWRQQHPWHRQWRQRNLRIELCHATRPLGQRTLTASECCVWTLSTYNYGFGEISGLICKRDLRVWRHSTSSPLIGGFSRSM